jgi:uncharacterized protein
MFIGRFGIEQVNLQESQDMIELDPEEYRASVERDMHMWLERAVIGLNLCPFAKAVHVKGLMRYVVSLESNPELVLDELEHELRELASALPEALETSLLVLPKCLQDFWEFNTFLKRVNRVVENTGLTGILQVASFHPDFQFADMQTGDITNYTNRAPYPTLHLLRESSIDRAIESYPNTETIFKQNMETLRALGHAGWINLDVGPHTGNLLASKS